MEPNHGERARVIRRRLREAYAVYVNIDGRYPQGIKEDVREIIGGIVQERIEVFRQVTEESTDRGDSDTAFKDADPIILARDRAERTLQRVSLAISRIGGVGNNLEVLKVLLTVALRNDDEDQLRALTSLAELFLE